MTDKDKLHHILSSLWKNDDSVGKTYYNQALQDAQIAIDSLQEEPVSVDLEEAAFDYAEACKYEGGEKLLCIEHFKAGAKYKEEQFERNRLEHCNNISNEQAELEQKFLDEHLDKHNRMPTFLDAIEYGMRLQKEQLMKNAVECEYFDGSLFRNDLREKYRDGDKVKVIVIKED